MSIWNSEVKDILSGHLSIAKYKFYRYDKDGNLCDCFGDVSTVVSRLIYDGYIEDRSSKTVGYVKRRLDRACSTSGIFFAGYLWSYELRNNYWDGINTTRTVAKKEKRKGVNRF